MKPHPHQVCTTPEMPSQKPLAGVKILLVEDERDVADLLLFIFEGAGAEVVWVTRAAEALVQLHDFQPDVLVCDIRLPDCNGNLLIQAIRRLELNTTQHLPAIAVTSYTREFASEKMLDAGFDRFLSKDFDINQFIAAILDLI